MDTIMKFIHGMLFFVAIAAVMLFFFGLKILAAIIFLGIWAFDAHFKDRCLGFYAGKREDCSVDYVIPEIMHDNENLDDGEVIDAEWEEIK